MEQRRGSWLGWESILHETVVFGLLISFHLSLFFSLLRGSNEQTNRCDFYPLAMAVMSFETTPIGV